MEADSIKYLLPHESEAWKHRSGLLVELCGTDSLQKAATIINKIHENNVWDGETLSKFKLSEARILQLLKFAAEHALLVERLFPDGIQISAPITAPEGKTFTVLTKRQALCLSTNMFFGTTFKQPDPKDLPVYFTFTRLTRRYTEVVRTYFNYLDRCEKSNKHFDSEHIVFFRLAETIEFQSWPQCEEKLAEVRFHTHGIIEDLGDAVQIDFANKSIGGFFLSDTYTQEDILFINDPQLIPALLFHKYMKPNECILMVGAERIAQYQGYLDTYTFTKDFVDDRKIIDLQLKQGLTVRVKDSWISAIDAIPWFNTSEFNQQNLNRQLNKAFVGFNIMSLDNGTKAISTGNWGSGAFNGNLQYKFLIQWLAASRAHRTIDYFSFDNDEASRIPEVVAKFQHFTVGQLTKLLVSFSNKFEVNKKVFKTLLSKGLEQFEQRSIPQ